MHLFRMLSDSLRGENRGETDLFDKVVKAFSKDECYFLNRNVLQIIDILNRFDEPFFREVTTKNALVDVFSTSFEVYQSYDVVKDC